MLSHLWYYAYMVRNKLLEEVRADYVLLAKSKGLRKRSVMFRHCLRNLFPSYLSMMAISVPPCDGRYVYRRVRFFLSRYRHALYESARYQDYNLLMLLCLLSGIVVILCNMLAQTINEQIDPRIRADTLIDTSEVTRL